MSLSSRIVERAASQVGVVEKPGNTGIPLERYALHGEGPAPWCARFVRWLFVEEGRPLPGNRWELGSVQRMEDACRAAGYLVAEPAPGDIVFFASRIGSDSGAGRHVGVVTAVSASRIQTIEGNSGNAVARRGYERSSRHIASYARIPE